MDDTQPVPNPETNQVQFQIRTGFGIMNSDPFTKRQRLGFCENNTHEQPSLPSPLFLPSLSCQWKLSLSLSQFGLHCPNPISILLGFIIIVDRWATPRRSHQPLNQGYIHSPLILHRARLMCLCKRILPNVCAPFNLFEIVAYREK